MTSARRKYHPAAVPAEMRPGVSLAAVVVLHAAALYAVAHSAEIVAPAASVPVMISIMTEEAPPAPRIVPRPKPRPAIPPPRAAVVPEPLPVPQPEPAASPPVEPAPATVIPPDVEAAYLNNPRPKYPMLSQRLGEQGRVWLRVYVNADGSAHAVHVDRSSGFPRLDAAAKTAVERWRFTPARQEGGAVGAWVVVPVSFTLSQQG